MSRFTFVIEMTLYASLYMYVHIYITELVLREITTRGQSEKYTFTTDVDKNVYLNPFKKTKTDF